MNRRLLQNSLSGTALYAVSVIVAFIMSPVYVQTLGNRDYGLWELVMSVIGYMGLLDLGIGGALLRFVAFADGKQDKKDLQQTISTAFIFFVLVGGVALMAFFFIGLSPEIIAGGDAKDIANLGTVFMLFGVNAVMLFPQNVFTATLMGMQRHYFINNTRILLIIGRAGLSYFLLFHYPEQGLIIMALLEPGFTSIQFALFAAALFSDKNMPRIVLSAATYCRAKEMILFGVKSATMLIASRLQNQSVPLIIGNVLGLGQIVYFVIPNRLIDYAKGMSRAIGFPLAAYFSAAVGKGDYDELIEKWLSTTLVLQIFALSMPIVLYFCGETFLGLWMGKEYSIAGKKVFYVLLAGLVADSLASNTYPILTANSQHGRTALVWFVLSLFGIPLGIWGAREWGILGVAFALTVVTILANMFTIIMACKVMNITLLTYFRKTLLGLTFPLLLMVLLLWTSNSILCPDKFYILFLQIFISYSLYFVSIWFFVIDFKIKNDIIMHVSVFITRLKDYRI